MSYFTPQSGKATVSPRIRMIVQRDLQHGQSLEKWKLDTIRLSIRSRRFDRMNDASAAACANTSCSVGQSAGNPATENVRYENSKILKDSSGTGNKQVIRKTRESSRESSDFIRCKNGRKITFKRRPRYDTFTRQISLCDQRNAVRSFINISYIYVYCT